MAITLSILGRFAKFFHHFVGNLSPFAAVKEF